MPKRTDKAGIAFLVLICILIALVVSILALNPALSRHPVRRRWFREAKTALQIRS